MGWEEAGGISMVLSWKLCLKPTLAGILKAFSSCSTKLRRSEEPDSLSVWISPVKLKHFLVSSIRGGVRVDDLGAENGYGLGGEGSGVGKARREGSLQG